MIVNALLCLQVRSGAIDLVVVDSVAALIPKREIEGDMGDANIALQARMMSQVSYDLLPLIPILQ